MTGKKLVAFYGSLRKGFHNHTRFGEMELVCEDSVSGYMTLVHESYPQLCLDKDTKHDIHKLELYNLTDEQFALIDNMELGAGYSQHTHKTPYGEAIMWVIEDIEDMHGRPISSYSKELFEND